MSAPRRAQVMEAAPPSGDGLPHRWRARSRCGDIRRGRHCKPKPRHRASTERSKKCRPQLPTTTAGVHGLPIHASKTPCDFSQPQASARHPPPRRAYPTRSETTDVRTNRPTAARPRHSGTSTSVAPRARQVQCDAAASMAARGPRTQAWHRQEPSTPGATPLRGLAARPPHTDLGPDNETHRHTAPSRPTPAPRRRRTQSRKDRRLRSPDRVVLHPRAEAK